MRCRLFGVLGVLAVVSLRSAAQAPLTADAAPGALPALVQANPAAAEQDAKDKNGNGNGNGDGKDDDKKEKEDKQDKPPRTLLEWAIGPKDEKPDSDEEDEKDTIVTDRPDFTEASSTVGKGRIQLESGYTYFRDRAQGARLTSHSYPEMLLRIGMFADWFELRLGQNFSTDVAVDQGVRTSVSGAQDTYLGCKIALTEQKGWLPETAVILQMTVPTGAREFTAEEVLPGVNFLYSWDIIPDCISLAGSTQANRSRSVFDLPVDPSGLDFLEVGHSYLTVAQSLSIGYSLGERLGAYTEAFALFPSSSIDPAVGPEYYFDGGFTYLITDNFQIDIRAGVGLNDHATDFFTGAGFAIRR